MEHLKQKKNNNTLIIFFFISIYDVSSLKFFKSIMEKGTVKFFNESKGYGFVIDSKDESEYFVHVSNLVDEIKEGDAVEFELEEGRKGLNAVNVKIAS